MGLCLLRFVAAAGAETGDIEEPPHDVLPDSSAEDPSGDDWSLDDLDLDSLLLEDDLALLYAEDIVVSATRRAQRISESPATITVIRREDIMTAGYRDLAEVMRTVPGAMVSRTNPMSVSVGIRSATTSTANLVLVLIDGRDQGLHLTGQPIWNSLPIDLESIERIEVIRGPGSSIYGANALQGVVNIITREPGEEPFSAEATVSGANLETFAGDLRLFGRSGKLRWWASAGYEQESYFQRPEERAFQTLRARAWAGVDLKPGLEGRVDAGYSNAEGWFGSPAGDGVASWGTGYLSTRLRARASEVQLSLEAGHGVFSPNTRLVAPPLAGGTESLDLGSFGPIGADTLSAELTAWHSISVGDDHTLMAGLSGRVIRHGEGALLVCPPGVLPAEFDLSACEDHPIAEYRGGVFLQDEWALGDRMILTLGGRLDTNSLHPGLGISPRAALVYSPVDNHSLRGSLGRAYRKPSYLETYNSVRVVLEDDVPDDLGRRLQHLFAELAPNPDLRNEKMTALELGWSWRLLGGSLTTAVDLFGALFEDRISGFVDVELEAGWGGVPRLSDDARITYKNSPVPQWAVGGEVSADYRVLSWLRLRAFYAFQRFYFLDLVDGETVLTDELWNPEHRLHLAARASHPSGWRAGLDVHALSGYRRYIQHPDSPLLPEIESELGETILVGGTISYALSVGPTRLELGLSGANLLGLAIRDLPAFETEERTFGGELIPRRFRLFLRGAF